MYENIDQSGIQEYEVVHEPKDRMLIEMRNACVASDDAKGDCKQLPCEYEVPIDNVQLHHVQLETAEGLVALFNLKVHLWTSTKCMTRNSPNVTFYVKELRTVSG